MGLIINSGTTITGGITLTSSIGGGGGGGGGLYMPTGTVTSLSGTYPSVVWEMGNAPSSLVIPDLSGNNLTFTESAESWNTNYYNFTSSNYATSDNTNFLDGITNQMTITGWFAFPSFSGSQSLVARNNGGPGWALRVDGAGNQLNLVKYNVADQTASLSSTLTTNKWYFIAVSQSGGSLVYKVGSDTVEDLVVSGASNNFQGTGLAVLLNKDPYIGGPWATAMREVKIFSTALTQTDLANIYAAEKSSYGY